MFTLHISELSHEIIILTLFSFLVVFLCYKKIFFVKQFKLFLILRSILIILILLLFIEPQLEIVFNQKIKKKWNIYLDSSLSMAYHEKPSVISLIKGSQELVNEFKRKEIDLNSFTFGANLDSNWVEDVDEVNGSSTDLGKVINHIKLNDDLISAAVIISDGQINSGVQLSNNNLNLKTPIYTLGVGNKTPLVDILIQSIEVPPNILLGENIDLKVNVTSQGKISEKLNVLLFSDEKIIGSKAISVSGNGSINIVKFRITPDKVGEINYNVIVNSAPQEVNIKNNQQRVIIQVLKNEYKVALITGAPSFNTGVIKKILNRNAEFKIDHYILTNQPYTLKNFWNKKYDLILFDNNPVNRNNDEWLSYLKIFAKKIISHQSSIGFFNGYDVNREGLKSFLSLIDVDLKESLFESNTEIDWEITKNWNTFFPFKQMDMKDLNSNNLPPLFSNLEIDSTNATSLANHILPGVKIPLLMVGEKKQIRFFIWSSPELFKLYYKTQNTKYNLTAEKILDPVFSWAMRTGSGDNFYFRSDKNSYQQGEKVIISGKSIFGSGNNLNGTIKVFSDGININSKPIIYDKDVGLYKGYFFASVTGEIKYIIEFLNNDKPIIVHENSIQIQESQIELDNVYLNKSKLDFISKLSKGKYYSWDDRNKVLDNLENDNFIQNIKEVKKFRHIIGFLLILLFLLFTEWSLRKRKGLS